MEVYLSSLVTSLAAVFWQTWSALTKNSSHPIQTDIKTLGEWHEKAVEQLQGSGQELWKGRG